MYDTNNNPQKHTSLIALLDPMAYGYSYVLGSLLGQIALTHPIVHDLVEQVSSGSSFSKREKNTKQAYHNHTYPLWKICSFFCPLDIPIGPPFFIGDSVFANDNQ